MNLIKKELLTGIYYASISKYSVVFISLIVSSILARILPPKDFGTFAIASVFINFFMILSELGFGPAIIQNKELNEYDTKSIFSFTIYLSFCLAFLFYWSSTLIANFYDKKQLIIFFRLLSINVLFSTLNIVPNALLAKQKLFKYIAFRVLIVQISTGIISIIVAINGFGLYTLLISPILGSFFTFLISLGKSKLKFNFRFQWKSIQKILSFSSYQFLFNLVNYFSRNFDNLLIGKVLGVTPLGYYEKSYRLMTMPLSNIASVVSSVLQPVLAEFQDDKSKIFNYYLKMIQLLALIGFPLSVFLFYSAGEIIFIVFGNQWGRSISIFKILSMSVGLQIILSTSGSIFQIANKVKLLFLSGLLSSLLVLSGIIYGTLVLKSLEGVAYGVIASFFINFIQAYYLLIVIALKSSFIEFIKVLLKPLLYSSILIMILYLVTIWLQGLNVYYCFSIKVIVTLLTYILILYISNDIYIFFNIFKTKNNKLI